MLEEGGKFAAEVIAPLNQSGDAEGCQLDKTTHEVNAAPKGFKQAYAKYVEGGWPALSCDRLRRPGPPHVVNQFFYEMLNSANQAWTMYPGLSRTAPTRPCTPMARPSRRRSTCPNSPAASGPAPCA